MKIKILKFDENVKLPKRAHYNDAGADVFSSGDYLLMSGQTAKIPLGFGLEIPDGMMGLIFPRSGLSSKGIVCELPPIDSGYRGEVHAVVTNCSNERYEINKGDRIGQLVIMPILIAEFSEGGGMDSRGIGAFGSTGN